MKFILILFILIFASGTLLTAEHTDEKIGTSGISLEMSLQDFLQLNTNKQLGFTIYTKIPTTLFTRYLTQDLTILNKKYICTVDIMSNKIQFIRLVPISTEPTFQISETYFQIKSILVKKYNQPEKDIIDIRYPYDKNEFVEALNVRHGKAFAYWNYKNAFIYIGIQKESFCYIIIEYATTNYRDVIAAYSKKTENDSF